MNAVIKRAVVCTTALLSLAAPLVAQRPAGSAPARVAPPALAARLGLMPLVTTNVPAFRNANPAFDGRGVVIGILDSGLDPSIEGLLRTTTGEAKVLDLRDFSGEGRVALSPVEMTGDTARVAEISVGGVGAWRPKAPGQWYGGVLRERNLGAPPSADLNGDGDDDDLLPLLVARIDGEWAVLVDHDGDGSLVGESPVHDFLAAHETLSWTAKSGSSPLALAVNLATVIGADMPALDLVFDTEAHGSHVAGIAAGHDIYGIGAFDGVAPGAFLLGLKISDNAQGGITTAGSMARAMDYAIRFARERKLPLVLNMSFGVGNELEGRARIDAIVDSVLRAHPDVVFTISAGNDGPGLSTVGFPGSASRAISVGATMPGIFRPAAEGKPGAPQEPVASFSSRGGELAKPDIVTPGVAYSTVPGWNTGDEIKGGTSMASPHAAGLAARLVSGLAQRGLPIDAARIRLALQASARDVPGAEFPDEGAGRPDLLKAWNWLTAAHDVEPLTVTLDGTAPGTSSLLRKGGVLAVDSTVSFTLSREQAGATRRYRLVSSADWLAGPAVITLEGLQVAVPVVMRAGPMSASRIGAVSVIAEADTSAGVLARLGVSMLATVDVGAKVPLAAGLNATARVAIPIEAGRAMSIEATPIGDADGADLSLYEPDGRPWRDGQTLPLGASDDSLARFTVDGRDALVGPYEVVLRGADAGPVKATLTAHAAPYLITGATRVGAVMTVAGRPAAGPAASAPSAKLVGAERRIPIEARGGLARRTPIALPAWVRRVVIDVDMPRAQWSRFTDFGVTLFDAESRQLGKEPMNYPGVRLVVDSLPAPTQERTVTLGLFPGVADEHDDRAWVATVSVRMYGETAAPLRSMPANVAKGSEGTKRWQFALPVTLPERPDGAEPLVRVLMQSGARTFTHEVMASAGATPQRRRVRRP